MSLHDRPEDVYAPPPAPAPSDSDVGDLGAAEEDRGEPGPGERRIMRRSRAIVIVVLAVCGVLLLGAIIAIVMLASGLLAATGDRGVPPSIPVVQSPTPAESMHTVRVGECSDLCTAMSEEIGVRAGDWTAEADWADAAADLGASEAATAVFSSEQGRGTITVLQFETDDEAAQAAVDVRARIGDPTYETTVFDDGSGIRYDFEGTLISRIVWHLGGAAREHVPGRLYFVEAPANAADDFSGQAAFQLYLALPL